MVETTESRPIDPSDPEDFGYHTPDCTVTAEDNCTCDLPARLDAEWQQGYYAGRHAGIETSLRSTSRDSEVIDVSRFARSDAPMSQPSGEETALRAIVEMTGYADRLTMAGPDVIRRWVASLVVGAVTPQEERVVAAAEKLVDMSAEMGHGQMADHELVPVLKALAQLENRVADMRRVGRLPA